MLRSLTPTPRLGFARTCAQVDQGLRAFMLGVYNNMVARPRYLGPRRARRQHGWRSQDPSAGRPIGSVS